MSIKIRRVALPVLAAGVLLICLRMAATAGVRITEQDQKQMLAGLLAEGPVLLFSREGVDGNVVVRGGWPFVVDYQLEKPGYLRLSIAAENGGEKIYRIPDEGSAPAGARQEKTLTLDSSLGDELQPGSLSLRAYEEGKADDQPVPFQLYGLGAGPEAVGSMTIVDVKFSPAEISVRGGQKAEYAFTPERSFNKVQVQILRLAGAAVPLQEVWQEIVNPTPSRNETIRRPWAGKDAKRHVSEGAHTLKVTAWYTTQGSWNAALSPTRVRVSR